MKFEKTPPTWNAEGSEPPSSLKTSGFQAGYKPPAAYFNWFWNKVSACLTELQTKLSNVDNTADADKSVKYASTSGSANKTKGSMVVRLNGGSTEGTDLFTFDGSTGKSVNITPSKIGAASESKLPFWATYGTTTNAEIETAYQAGKQVLVKTTDGYVGELFARLSSGKAHFFCAGVKIYRCFNGSWTDLSDSYGFTPTVHASTHKTGGSDPIKPEDIGAAAASNGTVLSQNADYAEVGQWADGNPNSENRIGYFVAIDDTQAGTTIIKATSTKDVRGVVVTAPAFSGNCSADKFDSNGNLLKQYAYVAVMGLVSVIDNGTCTINERCMPNDSGTAVPSTNNLGYQVIDRIDDTHILIAVEPGADMIQRIRTDVAALQAHANDKNNPHGVTAAQVGARPNTWTPKLADVAFLGNQPISAVANDTTANWATLGSGYAWYYTGGLLNNQPSSFGFLVSYVNGSDVFQIWRSQNTGPTYMRSGNASGWASAWVQVIDSSSIASQTVNKAKYASITTPGTASLKNIKAGTSDLTAGSSTLTTGDIYLVYE